jgi:hypothetical protein
MLAPGAVPLFPAVTNLSVRHPPTIHRTSDSKAKDGTLTRSHLPTAVRIW